MMAIEPTEKLGPANHQENLQLKTSRLRAALPPLLVKDPVLLLNKLTQDPKLEADQALQTKVTHLETISSALQLSPSNNNRSKTLLLLK